MNNKKIHFAAIDIGSNAIRLIIKGIEKDEITTVDSLEQDILVRFPLRLGDDAFTQGKISKEKIERLIHLMKAFRQMMKMFNIVACKAYATSAMRDAANGKKIVNKIRRKTGIHVEIINGEEEARIIYENHVERTLGQDKDYLYMDVGGGSTQISLIHLGEPIYSHSFNIGTVRMMNNIVLPEEKELFLQKLKELHAQYPDLRLIGSGGNIIKISKLQQDTTQRQMLKAKALETLYEELSPLSIEERMKKHKLKRDRAEVIVPAAAVFQEAIRVLEVPEVIVPSIGIADGIVNNLFASYTAEKS